MNQSLSNWIPRVIVWCHLVKKNQTKLTDEIDRKILSIFLLGMSYRDIRGHVEDMYDIDVSEATISGVTERLIPLS
ncbi:transposase [Vibrio vulnificus]|nr:transposase [Vibrio vulnificus]